MSPAPSLRLEFLPADLRPLSDLARLALSGRPQPAGLGVTVPRQLAELEPAPTPDPALLERAELASALEARLLALGAPPAALASARSLAHPGATLVVTGQQPGLFGGPLMTLHKAAHAVALARRLEAAWSAPVVPLFWIHGDDHDAAEAGQQHFLNPNLDVARLGLPGFGPSRRMLSRRLLDREVHRLDALRAACAELLPRTADGERALACLAPRHGESLVTPQARLLLETLGEQGLVVLDPEWIRPALSRALVRLLSSDPAQALEAGRRRAAAALGELAAERDRPPVLAYQLDQEGRRRALRAHPEGWLLDGEPAGAERTPEEVAAAVAAAPSQWSAAAHLRPLTQDLCLPVSAYVGGWGELRYGCELGELRGLSGVRETPFVPRFSCSLVTEQVRVAAGKIPTELHTFLSLNGQINDTYDEEKLHPALEALAEELQRHREALDRLRPELAELDRGLALQLRRAAANGDETLRKVLSKYIRLTRNRGGKDRRHLRRLHGFLLPRGQAQERLLGPGPFLAAAGFRWPAALAEEIEPFPTEPALVHLPPGTEGWL